MSSLGTATSLADKAMREASSMVKDTMGLESEQMCPAALTVQAVMANRQSADDPLLYLDPNPRVRPGFCAARRDADE